MLWFCLWQVAPLDQQGQEALMISDPIIRRNTLQATVLVRHYTPTQRRDLGHTSIQSPNVYNSTVPKIGILSYFIAVHKAFLEDASFQAYVEELQGVYDGIIGSIESTKEGEE